MIYWTKKEVLEALGKNEKDVRYLDRAIARWDVVEEWWGYIIMKEYVENLQWKVKQLEKELQKEKEKSEWIWNIVQAKSVLSEEDREGYLKQINDLEKKLTESEIKQWELEQRNAYLESQLGWEWSTSSVTEMKELKVNCEYWENECKRYGKLYNSVFSVCYRKVKWLLGSKFTMSESEFKEWIKEEIENEEKNN